MREAPEQVPEPALLAIVSREWDDSVDELEHLPVGFGAHHWAASARGERRLFVTFDHLEPKRAAADLEAAYAAAADLAAGGLDFVLPCLPAGPGLCTVPCADGAVSATRWVDGRTGDGPPADAAEAIACATMLSALHAASPPPDIPRWQPMFTAESFLDGLTRLVATPWSRGPYGEDARRAIEERMSAITSWAGRYEVLTERAVLTRDSWVPTHGEPDTGNQLVTGSGQRFLVDWESLKLAPRERDFASLIRSGLSWATAYEIASADLAMVQIFDTEWRLSEIGEYAAWFHAEHYGTASDAVAFDGLLQELGRSDDLACPPGGY